MRESRVCLSLYRKKELEYMQKPIKLRKSGHRSERVTLLIELLRLSSNFCPHTDTHALTLEYAFAD